MSTFERGDMVSGGIVKAAEGLAEYLRISPERTYTEAYLVADTSNGKTMWGWYVKGMIEKQGRD